MSARVEWLCAALVLAQAALLALAGLSPQALESAAAAAALAALWVSWLALQLQNYRLVRLGNQAERHRAAPRFVNEPDFFVRMLFHVIVNWSVIATTLVIAWRTDAPALSAGLAWLCLIAAAAVWMVFNTLHRRMNRARNLVVTTAFGATLAAAALALIVTG